MITSLGTIRLILEGVGAMLAVVGIGGATGIAVAVLIRKPSEEVGQWGQIGTTIGLLLGIPVGIAAVLLLSN